MEEQWHSCSKVEATLWPAREFCSTRGLRAVAGHQLHEDFVEEAPALAKPQEVVVLPRPPSTSSIWVSMTIVTMGPPWEDEDEQWGGNSHSVPSATKWRRKQNETRSTGLGSRWSQVTFGRTAWCYSLYSEGCCSNYLSSLSNDTENHFRN